MVAEVGTDEAAEEVARPLALSCVILTMGDRPAEVNRAIDSVLAQRGTPVELVVVANGADVPDLPADVKVVRLPENVGVAAGRNAGVQACGGDVVLFLDDDGWYPDHGLAAYVAGRFEAEPELAVLSMRVVDPDGGPGARAVRADPGRGHRRRGGRRPDRDPGTDRGGAGGGRADRGGPPGGDRGVPAPALRA